MLSFIPTNAAVYPKIFRQFLPVIPAEAVLDRPYRCVVCNLWRWGLTFQVIVDRVLVYTHVGFVHKVQDPRCALPARDERFAQFELRILGSRARESPIQIDSIGYRRHRSETVADAPVAIVVFKDS